ncbi:TPA: PTS mannose/fructose/sorbose transporter subunit IIC [Escherichia coli]|nr:PTS mannose/fructose/sorbose transporter subunit IIC [Escherichia coli]
MVNAIFCAHGKLACAMLESVQMVYGNANVEAVEFVPGENAGDIVAKLEKLVSIHNQDEWLIAVDLQCGSPWNAAGQVLTVFARTITVVFQHAADKAAEEARFRTLDILHVSALGVQALRVAIPALIVSLFVSADMVSNMLSAIPEFVTRGLQIAGGFIVVVGYAMVLRMMGVKYLMPFFFLGFLAGGYLDLSLLAFGGVGVIMALVYIQLNPQWRKAEPQPQATTSTALDQLDD